MNNTSTETASSFPSPQDSFLSTDGDDDGDDEKGSIRSNGPKTKERNRANYSQVSEQTGLSNSIDESFEDNCDHQDDHHIMELKSEIDYWNKLLVIGNSSVIAFGALIIILYFTTNIFPKEDLHVTEVMKQMKYKCLNETMMEENDIDSFVKCATFCSDVLSADSIKEADRMLSTEQPETNETMPVITCNGINGTYPYEACDDICTPTLTEKLEYFSEQVEKVCDRDQIQSDNLSLKLCKTGCAPFDCCFSLEEDTNCLEEHKLLCGSFHDSCAPLHENAAMFGIGIGPVIIPEDGEK